PKMVPLMVEALKRPSAKTFIVAHSSPGTSATQPRQLSASSFTSTICFSSAIPPSGDSANTAERSTARWILIADLLLSHGEGVQRVQQCFEDAEGSIV